MYGAGEPAASAVAFPTDSKERERDKRNELKAQGIDPKTLVKKKHKYIEPHYDDCGEDLSSLNVELEAYVLDGPVSFDYWTNTLCCEESSDEEADGVVTTLPVFMLWGPDPHLVDSLLVYHATTVTELAFVVSTKGLGYDIAEINGKVECPSQLSVRRHLTTGKNFDLVTQFHSQDTQSLDNVLQYFCDNKVLVAVLTPPCGPTDQQLSLIHI